MIGGIRLYILTDEPCISQAALISVFVTICEILLRLQFHDVNVNNPVKDHAVLFRLLKMECL